MNIWTRFPCDIFQPCSWTVTQVPGQGEWCSRPHAQLLFASARGVEKTRSKIRRPCKHWRRLVANVYRRDLWIALKGQHNVWDPRCRSLMESFCQAYFLSFLGTLERVHAYMNNCRRYTKTGVSFMEKNHRRSFFILLLSILLEEDDKERKRYC